MSDADGTPDEALMLALRAGEDTALDTLVRRWEIPLRSFLQRHLRNEADALDLAQETFVRIFRHRARYRDGARFSTWMFQIALNLARDHARRRTRRPTTPLELAPESVDPAASAPAALQSDETTTAVREAIAALPDNLRESLLLSVYQDLPHREIATIVGASPKAIESRLARARDLLRTRLARWLT